MSQNPYAPYDPATPLSYSTPAPGGNAPTLILLAGIFNAVIGGLDVLSGLVCVVFAIIMPLIMNMSPPDPGAPPNWVLSAVYGGIAVLSLAGGAVNGVAAFKFLKKRPNACTCGMVAGITSCLHLWCGGACFLPMASGIFTIVVSSLASVRAYLITYSASQPPTP